MRFAPVLLSAVLAATILAGCSSQSNSKEADDYSGTDKAVVTVVDDLINAAAKKDGKEICTTILSSDRVAQLNADRHNCADVVDDQLDDASNFDLDVTKVTVTGDTAQVVTKSDFNTDDDTVRTLTLAKQDNDWRVTGIEDGG